MKDSTVRRDININTPKNEARWIASLSNGEIVTEGKGKFEEIKGELSPWQKLTNYIAENELDITGLAIKLHGRSYFLPTQSPKFGGEVPYDYNYSRHVISDVIPNRKDRIQKFIFIEAFYKHFKVRLWVDEMGYKNSWVSIHAL